MKMNGMLNSFTKDINSQEHYNLYQISISVYFQHIRRSRKIFLSNLHLKITVRKGSRTLLQRFKNIKVMKFAPLFHWYMTLYLKKGKTAILCLHLVYVIIYVFTLTFIHTYTHTQYLIMDYRTQEYFILKLHRMIRCNNIFQAGFKIYNYRHKLINRL